MMEHQSRIAIELTPEQLNRINAHINFPMYNRTTTLSKHITNVNMKPICSHQSVYSFLTVTPM